MPAVEGLFPSSRENDLVQHMLFELAHWHALAKLRLHTSITLRILRAATTTMTESMRRFRDRVCSKYVTTELQKEVESRDRRAAKRAEKAAASGKPPPKRKAPAGKAKVVQFRALDTYKFHCIGDIEAHIWEYGPTDCYNTQVVSCANPACVCTADMMS